MAPPYGVRGADELAKLFQELGRGPTKAQRRKARFAALEPVKKAAQANLQRNQSEETGALIASLTITDDEAKDSRSVLGSRKGKVKGRVPSAYAHLVEFGTRPHWQPNRFGGIMHPGARPKPFIRPAAETTKEEAAQAYAETLGQEIMEAAARTAARAPRRR